MELIVANSIISDITHTKKNIWKGCRLLDKSISVSINIMQDWTKILNISHFQNYQKVNIASRNWYLCQKGLSRLVTGRGLELWVHQVAPCSGHVSPECPHPFASVCHMIFTRRNKPRRESHFPCNILSGSSKKTKTKKNLMYSLQRRISYMI